MRWAKRAGIGDNVHFHVSRHTFGTLLMTAEVDLYIASKLMGNADGDFMQSIDKHVITYRHI